MTTRASRSRALAPAVARSSARVLSRAATRPLRGLLGAAVALALCACAPSEEEIREEFASYVSGANHCQQANECAVAGADCPLGCYVAVRQDRVQAVERKARELVDDYRSGGLVCAYDCAEPGELECSGGRCALSRP